MSEVQTPLNSVISLAHKTAQIAQPPTRIPFIAKVHPVRKFGRGFKPLPNYNKVSSPPLRTGHLSNRLKISRATSGKITVAFPYDQEFLGHKDVSTTMICTHVLNRGPVVVRSPVDGL